MENEYFKQWMERRKDKREREKQRAKEERDALETIEKSIDETKMEFLCIGCKKEYIAIGKKHIGHLGPNLTAWYVGKCKCGMYNMRRITGKMGDKYFLKAKSIQKSRVVNFNDTIDFTHPMFKVLYPKQYKEFEEKRLKQYE